MTDVPQSISVDATAANNTATALLPPRPVGVRYVVSQISVTSDSILSSIATVILNGQIVTRSPFGNDDTAAGLPPVFVRPGDKLSVVWTNATNGAHCIATFYYTEVGPNAVP